MITELHGNLRLSCHSGIAIGLDFQDVKMVITISDNTEGNPAGELDG